MNIETTSQAAIIHHYDLGADFFKKMLDPSMTYSAALWSRPGQTLWEAQLNKLQWHADQLGCSESSTILEIGCGFGSMIEYLSQNRNPRQMTGLSLSLDQLAYCQSQNPEKAVFLEKNWTDFTPHQPYDGIVSIGAFEHFATTRQSLDERLRVYKTFFKKCHEWLVPDGRLSLQSIIYHANSHNRLAPFIHEEIFKESELPTLSLIEEAATEYFEVTQQRLDGDHYEMTLTHWYENLLTNRPWLEENFGKDTVKKFRLYLMHSRYGFSAKITDLLRISYQRR